MTSVPAKSEQAEYAVFELARCDAPEVACRDAARLHIGWCPGCLRDGTRVDLSSGLKVEPDNECVDIFFDDRDRWVAVPSTEETND